MVLNTTVAANAEANSLKNVVVNGTASLILNQSLPSPISPLPQTAQDSNIPQLGSQTTPLLSKFIEAQSEIWKHKYVFVFSLSLLSSIYINDNLHPELIILLKSMVTHCQWLLLSPQRVMQHLSDLTTVSEPKIV